MRVLQGVWAGCIAVAAGLGCDGDTEPVETDSERTACEGGGAPTLELGLGGRSAFVPFDTGDDIEITQDGAGAYGFGFELLTTGLDTTESVNAVLRVTVGTDPVQDFIALFNLQCDEDLGVAWVATFTPLDDPLQDPVLAEALVGQPVLIDVSLSDARQVVGDDEVDLFAAWPP